MRKIGIIGAGTMGVDLAHAFSQADFQVILVDKNPNQFKNLENKLKFNLRFQKFHLKAKSLTSREELLSKIHCSTDINSLQAAPFIIENVTEDWKIKKTVHNQLEKVILPETIVAVNTSAISITRIGSLKRNPKNLIGLHFMNPAYVMPVVEMILGVHTSDETLRTTEDLLGLIGKKSILVKDSPGFVTNRAMMVFINEAIYCLNEGISTLEGIDSLFKGCFGHKMGPLQTADLIGLDTILKSLEVLYESFADSKYRPCIRLKQMVDAGFLGVKSKRGFYEYLDN